MKVLVTGARGMLGQAVVEELSARSHECVPLDRVALDVTDAAAVRATLRAERPDAVIQCAAWTAVDAAEPEEARATAVNGAGAANVARSCAEIGARFVYPSTDYVFDGTAARPYPVDAPVAPVNAYGRSKLAGEVAARSADALVVRTSWLYGRGGRNFISGILARGRAGEPLRVVTDQRGAPTWTADLARMLVLLLERDAAAGTYHATNAGETTWYDVARTVLELADLKVPVEPITSASFAAPARRPGYSVLDCTSTYAITGAAPHWRAALETALAQGL